MLRRMPPSTRIYLLFWRMDCHIDSACSSIGTIFGNSRWVDRVPHAFHECHLYVELLVILQMVLRWLLWDEISYKKINFVHLIVNSIHHYWIDAYHLDDSTRGHAWLLCRFSGKQVWVPASAKRRHEKLRSLLPSSVRVLQLLDLMLLLQCYQKLV